MVSRIKYLNSHHGQNFESDFHKLEYENPCAEHSRIRESMCRMWKVASYAETLTKVHAPWLALSSENGLIASAYLQQTSITSACADISSICASTYMDLKLSNKGRRIFWETSHVLCLNNTLPAGRKCPKRRCCVGVIHYRMEATSLVEQLI